MLLASHSPLHKAVFVRFVFGDASSAPRNKCVVRPQLRTRENKQFTETLIVSKGLCCSSSQGGGCCSTHLLPEKPPEMLLTHSSHVCSTITPINIRITRPTHFLELGNAPETRRWTRVHSSVGSGELTSTLTQSSWVSQPLCVALGQKCDATI